MRQFALIGVAMLLVTLPSFANSEQAIAAFNADSSVRQAMEQIPEGYQIDQNIQTMIINTFCGWAGCFETNLVSARVVPVDNPINPRSWSIVAKVVVHSGTIAPRVELLTQDFFDNRTPNTVVSGGCWR